MALKEKTEGGHGKGDFLSGAKVDPVGIDFFSHRDLTANDGTHLERMGLVRCAVNAGRFQLHRSIHHQQLADRGNAFGGHHAKFARSGRGFGINRHFEAHSARFRFQLGISW